MFEDIINRIEADLEQKRIYVKSMKPPPGTPLYRGKLGSYYWYPKSSLRVAGERGDTIPEETDISPAKISSKISVKAPPHQIPSDCASCGRYWEDQCCDAYPEGIPALILQGHIDHHYEYDGDGGLTWIPMSPSDELLTSL